jgi:hypothetical protein
MGNFVRTAEKKGGCTLLPVLFVLDMLSPRCILIRVEVQRDGWDGLIATFWLP